MEALVGAIDRQTGEAAAGLSIGKLTWWKPREAALQGVGYVAEYIAKPRAPGSPVKFDLGHFLEGTLKNDVRGQCPYLVGRSLWVVAKLASMMSPEQAAPFAQAAVSGVLQLLRL